LRNSHEGCLHQCRQPGDAHANASWWRQFWPGFATALVVAFGSALPALAADLEFVETEQLRIVYFDPGAYFVPHATQSFLSGLASHKRLFGYVPDGRVNVLLQDFSDRANAAAIPAPRNRIFLDIAPSNEPFETVSSGEWFGSTSVHELTHLVDNDSASPADARSRRMFHGKVDVDAAHPETLLYNYLTTPRLTAPRWYQEGSAVFMETWMSGGVGRAQGGYDEMVFRAMVQENARFYDPLGLVSKGTEIDFKTAANAYLYGTRFTDYLALTYGPQRLLAWWRRDADSRRYYAHDFQRVFGLALDESWRQWIDWEHRFQQQNLLVVREHPVTEHRDLTQKDLGAVSRTYLSADGTRLFAAIKYPGQLAHLVSIGRSDGRVTELKEVKGASGYTVTSLAYDPATGTLFYTTNNNTHRNLEALELRSGKSRMLLRAARIGDMVYNPSDRSLWGLRLNNGFVMLVRIPFPYKEWRTLYDFPRGEKAFDLDLSPDGALASVSVSGPGLRPGSPQVTQVRVLRADALAGGDATPVHTFAMGAAVPEGFVFSKDGRYLYGSSYYTGVSNIYRYELATETLTAVSNADVGFFRPLPLDESQLIALRYAAKGFVPTLIKSRPTEDLSAVTFLGEQVAAKYPEVQGWVAPAPSTIPYESLILRKGPYRPMRELSLESLIPAVEGYKNSVGLGASARFSDPMGYDSLGVDTSYSPDDRLPAKQRLHVAAGVHHTRWTGGVAWNGADFYDLFGPTKRSLAGYSGYLGYDLPLIFDPPQAVDFVAKVAYYGGLDTLPGFQNVNSPSKNLFTADAGFVAVDARASPGAVDAETGYSWTINAHANGAAGDLIPSLTGTFDVGFPLPLNHSSIWLRSGASLSTGARANPLANSYLGGFGNNYVDSGGNGGAQRYRELLSMPGFKLDALNGKSLLKSTLEWCLPPLRFEAVGSPGFYLSWARPEVFFSALETDPDNRALRRSAHDVGVQLDLQLHVMHRQSMMLSVGAARGFSAAGLGRSEFMLSLQVL
jgi:hypothetical protein